MRLPCSATNLLRCFTVIYLAALLFMSAFVTYHGSYNEYSQNDTKVVQEEADAEDMRPIIAICRLPGELQPNFT
jgi:hypothetical protein